MSHGVFGNMKEKSDYRGGGLFPAYAPSFSEGFGAEIFKGFEGGIKLFVQLFQKR